MSKHVNLFLVNFLLFFIIAILIPPKYITILNYRINNYEYKALSGDKTAYRHVFICYMHIIEDYHKAIDIFRKIDSKYQNAKLFLGYSLCMSPPQSLKKYLEGLSCLYEFNHNMSKGSFLILMNIVL